MIWLGEGQEESTYEVSFDVATSILITDVIQAISEHLRVHIEEEHAVDGICEHQLCHTNMYALTAEVGLCVHTVDTAADNQQQQDEHESIHRDNTNIEEERDQLLEQVKDLEDTVTERDRLQQQVNHLQDAANERDQLLENLKDITEERDSLQERSSELSRQLNAASGLDDRRRTKEPEAQVDENPTETRKNEALSKLRYCNICLKSVNKMSANVRLFRYIQEFF